MKRFTFYIAILFLTFVFSVGVTKVYFTWHIQFRCKGIGGMLVPPDGEGRFATFVSFDGEKLSSSFAVFPSPESAQAALQKTLQESVEVIERKPIYNDSGEMIGERVVAKFPPDEIATDGYVAIITLKNDRIFDIASTSLRHAVAFENGAPR